MQQKTAIYSPLSLPHAHHQQGTFSFSPLPSRHHQRSLLISSPFFIFPSARMPLAVPPHLLPPSGAAPPKQSSDDTTEWCCCSSDLGVHGCRPFSMIIFEENCRCFIGTSFLRQCHHHRLLLALTKWQDKNQRRSGAASLILVTVINVVCHHHHLHLLPTLGEHTLSSSQSCSYVPRYISCTLDDVWLTFGKDYQLYVS